MQVAVKKWGNSVGIRIPASLIISNDISINKSSTILEKGTFSLAALIEYNK